MYLILSLLLHTTKFLDIFIHCHDRGFRQYHWHFYDSLNTFANSKTRASNSYNRFENNLLIRIEEQFIFCLFFRCWWSSATWMRGKRYPPPTPTRMKRARPWGKASSSSTSPLSGSSPSHSSSSSSSRRTRRCQLKQEKLLFPAFLEKKCQI